MKIYGCSIGLFRGIRGGVFHYLGVLLLVAAGLAGLLPARYMALLSPSEAGASETVPGESWDNLSYTPGGGSVVPPGPLSSLGLYWGMPPFSGSQEAFDEGGSWFLAAGREGGAWTDAGWQVADDDPGPAWLWIALDRETLPPGISMALVAGVSVGAALHADLLDGSGEVVAADVLGNLATDPDGLTGEHFIPLPFEAFEQASILRLRRASGAISLQATLLAGDLDPGLDPEDPLTEGAPVAPPLPFCPATQAVIDAIRPSWLHGGIPGRLLVEVWRDVPGHKVMHLHACRRFPGHPDERAYADTTQVGSIGDFYGRRIRGTVTPVEDGVYRFRIAGDDESEFWLSADATPYNVARIAHVPYWTYPEEFDKYPSQYSPPVLMEAGVPRYIEILQKEDGGGDHVNVQWSRDDGPWTVIGPEFLHSFVQPATWVVSIWEAYLGDRSVTWSSDTEENGMEHLVSGADADWAHVDGALHALGLRGTFTFALQAGTGIHAVEIEGLASSRVTQDPVDFALEVFSDGLSLGRGLLRASHTEPGQAHFFLPHREEAGTVNLTVRLRSIDPNHYLAVTAVRLVGFAGETWQDHRRQDASGHLAVPETSFTSPAFIEGRARWIERLTLAAGGSPVTPSRGIGHGWYADVPLSASAPTPVTLLDAESGLHADREIVWQPWDLSGESPEEGLLVRVNDAMRFTAPGTLTLHVNGAPWDQQAPLSHREQELAAGLYRYRLRALYEGEGEGPWTMSENDCEVARTARAGTVVDSYWGGHYVNGNTNLRGTQDGEIADFNGDGSLDYRRVRPFDESTLLSPSTTMPGKSTRFYGGVRATYYGTDIARPFSRFMVRNVAGDPVQIATDLSHGGEKSLYGAVVWRAQDFMGLDDGEFATFAHADDAMALSVATESGAVTPAFRFLVKTGGRYYVSLFQGSPTDGTSATLFSLSNPAAAAWAPYDPAADLVFDAATASFTPIAFEAIEAAGYLFEMGTTEVPVNFRNHGFSVDATIASCLPSPVDDGLLTVPLRSSTGGPTIRWGALDGATGYELQRARLDADLGQWGEWETVCLNEVEPLHVIFGQSGTYLITGEWEEEGIPVSGMLVVRAVSSVLNTHTALWVNRPRLWTQPGLAPEVHLECDEGLRLNEQLPPPAHVRGFILGALRPGSYGVIGRLGGPNGPVVCRATIEAFDLLSTNQTGVAFTGEMLPDGSRIMDMPISAGDLPAGAMIRLRIFVAGVTFEDGSTEKWISAEDLDAHGQITVRFIYPEGQPTSVCHTLEVWQGGEIIATR